MATGIRSGTWIRPSHGHSSLIFVTIRKSVIDGVTRAKINVITVRLIKNFPAVFISSSLPIIFATSFHFLLRTNYPSTFLLLSDVKSKFRRVAIFKIDLKTILLTYNTFKFQRPISSSLLSTKDRKRKQHYVLTRNSIDATAD